MSCPGHREAFFSLFWLGQGVTRVGILCYFVYVFLLCFVFLVLAWCGSQSEAAVNRCLWLRTILRQPVFPLWVVGSYFLFSVFCLWQSCFCCSFVACLIVFSFTIKMMNIYHAAPWSSPSSTNGRYRGRLANPWTPSQPWSTRGISIMLWGCLAAGGTGALHKIDVIMG